MFLLSAKVQVSFAVIKFKNWRYKIISDNRTEILNFKVSKEEKRIIEDKAFIKYDTLAPYLRDCALGKEILVIPGLSGIQDELNAIGNNLNQLTRAVNSGMCSAVDLTEMRMYFNLGGCNSILAEDILTYETPTSGDCTNGLMNSIIDLLSDLPTIEQNEDYYDGGIEDVELDEIV